MNIPIDSAVVASVAGSATVAGIGWIARFMRKIDQRLTRIETVLKIKKILEPSPDES